jgi:hypothetical protein
MMMSIAKFWSHSFFKNKSHKASYPKFFKKRNFNTYTYLPRFKIFFSFGENWVDFVGPSEKGTSLLCCDVQRRWMMSMAKFWSLFPSLKNLKKDRYPKILQKEKIENVYQYFKKFLIFSSGQIL